MKCLQDGNMLVLSPLISSTLVKDARIVDKMEKTIANFFIILIIIFKFIIKPKLVSGFWGFGVLG